MSMDLIYLWCEKYHNIHNCGFAFSHNWIVNYRKETKELFIKPNHSNKRVNPYPHYISNVTAIIGKNGTGKSSLLDLLGWQFRSFQFEDASFFQVYYLDKNRFLISLFTNSSAPYVFSDPEDNINDEVAENNYESSLIVNIQDDPKNGRFKFKRKVIANLNHETLFFDQEYDEKVFLFPKKRPLIPIQYFFPVEEIKINSEFHTPGDYIIDRFKISECGFEDKYHFLCEFGYYRRNIYGGLLYGDIIFEIRKPYDHNGLDILLPEDDFEFVFGEKIKFNTKKLRGLVLNQSHFFFFNYFKNKFFY